jgi:autotransporter-associated beta strand protein
MKLHQAFSNRLGTLAALAVFLVALPALPASTPVQWVGNNAVGNFSNNDNWNLGGAAPATGFGYELHFLSQNNTSQSSLYDDWAWVSFDNIIFDSGFPSNPLNGGGNGIYFNQTIENDSASLQTVNIPTSGNKNSVGHIELNPMNGDLTLLQPVYNDLSVEYQVWGGNSKTLTVGSDLVGGVASRAGVILTVEAYSKVKLTAAQTWGDGTHGVNLNQGEFWLDSDGSLASNSVPIKVGLSDGNVAKLWLSVATGGQALANPITVNNSDTPAEKTIGGLNTSGTSTFNSGLTLNGQVNLSAATGGTVVFAGPISGSSQNVVVNGYGLPLSGVIVMSATNTYSGNTYIFGGTLQFSATGSASKSPTIYLGETSGSQTATLALGATGGGQNFTNLISVLSGSTGTKTISSLATSGTNRLTGNIALADPVAINSASGGNLALSGVISGSFGLTNIGSGTTMLYNTNTYTGGTTIKAGTIVITGGSSTNTTGPLGPSNSVVWLGDTSGAAAATLTHSGTAAMHYYPITVQAGSSGIKTLADASSKSVNYKSNLVLNDSVTLDSGGSGNIILTGPVTGSGGLNKISSGTAQLIAGNSANAYTGNTTISQGVFQLGSATAIPKGSGVGTVIINPASPNTATLDLNSFNQTINGLTSSGTGSAVVDDTSTTSVTLTVGIAGSNPSGTFAGVLQNSSPGKLGLTKAGSGTLTLTGANTYGGNTTITGGTLALSGTGSIANTPNIILAGGAILNVSGLSSTFTLGGGQTLSNSASATGIINGNFNTGTGTNSLTYTSGTPSLTITNGTLTIASGTVFKVNNTTGSALMIGSYKITSKATAGNVGAVTATTLPAVTVSGGGITPGTTALLQIVSGELDLVVSLLPTTTTFSSSVNPSTYGGSVTFTATLKTNGVTVGNAASNYVFKVDGVALATSVVTGGSATFTTTNLTAAAHSLTAEYSSDAIYASSTNSPALTQTVNPLAVGLTGTRAYDATTNVAFGILSVTNVVGSDIVTVASGTGGMAGKNVGSQAITSVGTLALGGAQAPNYTLAGAVGLVSISPAGVFVSVISSSPTNGYLDNVTFTAAVQTNSVTAGDAGGTITFQTNTVVFGGPVGLTAGVAGTNLATLPRGTNLITAIYSGDSNYLGSTNSISQIVTNHPPVVSDNSSYSRNNLPSWKITISDLLTNLTDVDTDSLTLVSVSASTNGITLDTNSWPGSVAYYNASQVDDQFSYTVTDGFGGTNTGTITLTYANVVQLTGANSISGITLGRTNLIKAQGMPSYNYILERATNLTPAVWSEVSTNAAATTNGVINAIDDFNDLGGVPPASAYYRLKWQQP